MSPNSYIISVDGGASSSLCATISLQGDLIGLEKGKPIAAIHSNYRVRKNLLNLIKKTLKKKGIDIENCKRISVGIAGTPYILEEKLIESITQILGDLDHECDFLINPDIKTTWAGATALEEGVSVYSGTGSNAYGINKKGKSVGVDFMGSLLGDNGSGYDIGVKALRSVAESLDGRGENTSLKGTIFEEFGLKKEADFFRKDWRSLPRKRIAKLSKIVNEEAKSDKKAKDILEEAGDKLADYGKTVIRRLDVGSVDHIYYSGGVFKSPYVLNSFIQNIRREITVGIEEALFNPVLGAYLLACGDISVTIDDDLLINLDKIKKKIDKLRRR
ncbi:hypothetical protein AKJ63_01280 [candidate division MSBL1 archaeon SCGC-AAA259D18]|uniref:ATPase BadF/BadG/BcrA/BcrD type domain-containing protein n=1 Tax=candidate division MSBL1 archaeon SCGC-AAA259D18 TaxID=1698262 RepID=A0A133UBJ7_9EURY|nr:hypothetical protein AKJ63_01280 [candidate division MSBL1 archaeon SCGC-AAA259D18]